MDAASHALQVAVLVNAASMQANQGQLQQVCSAASSMFFFSLSYPQPKHALLPHGLADTRELYICDCACNVCLPSSYTMSACRGSCALCMLLVHKVPKTYLL